MQLNCDALVSDPVQRRKPLHHTTIIAVVLVLGVISLLSSRIERSPVTIPLLCLAAGLGAWYFGGIRGGPESSIEILRIIAEATLAIVLFTDAANLKLSRFRHEVSWPFRMLVIGLPLAVVFGALVNFVFLPAIGIWELLLIAALLAPTDAALGASVFSNEEIPARIRDSILAESGLNDGLALPLIIFFACIAVGGQHDFAQDNWLIFAAQQIGFGLLAGALSGAGGGFLLNRAIKAGLAREKHAAIYAFLIIGLTYLVAEEMNGNSFVAVFIAGMAFGAQAGSAAKAIEEFLEAEGLLLTMVSFVFIGAYIVPVGFERVDASIAIVVLASLFLIRPLAVTLSLAGSNVTIRESLFMGWFGPRGLATALFAVFVLAEFSNLKNRETIIAVTALAVTLSTVLHGASAYWAGKWFRSGEAKR